MVWQDVNDYFKSKSKAASLRRGLEGLAGILSPIAKACKCLEATHSTVGDVYLFWLACTATAYDIITTQDADIPDNVKDEIRLAFNHRFDQMVNDVPCDVFLPGFILDPRMSLLRLKFHSR